MSSSSSSQAATERVYRVAYVETNRDLEDIRFTFAQCGEIRGIYPFKTGDRQKSVHFFVEFNEQHSVKRARALQLRDAKVHVLAYSPDLVEHFALVAPEIPPMASDQPMEAHEYVMRPWAPGKPYSPVKSYAARKQKKKVIHKDPGAYQSWGPMRSDHPFSVGGSEEHNKENAGVVPQAGTSGLSLLTPPLSVDGVLPTSTRGTPLGSVQVKVESLPSSPIRPGPPTPAKATLPPRPVSPAHIPPSPAIVLNYGGTPFHCRLDQLSDDPGNIITVLTQTCAQALERDKWMIVAAYYRNKRNTQAALDVVAAMVNVLTSPAVGLPESELKPAYLMLAGCYGDLSKTASADVAKKHMARAQECLYKVYGANAPSIAFSSISQTGVRDGQRGHAVSSGSGPAARSVSHGKTDRPVNQPRASAADESRLRVLEREVQSLRDRHTNATANLATARAAKRQLEDDLTSERDTRRKVERELADALGELNGACRGEKYAIEQCRREVDSRRRTEERAAELRDELALLRRELDAKARETAEREKKVRETFGQFGELFTRAAKGEADLANGWARSASSMPPPTSVPMRARTVSAPQGDKSVAAVQA